MITAFQKYFKEIRNKYLTKDYTEGTLRTPFENFIKDLNKEFDLTQEPKRVKKLGAPDFKASNKSIKIGYIETKDLDKNLDNELEGEQIKKYKESINNIILTDYKRFILIRNSQKVFDFNLFNLSDLDNSKFVISNDKTEEFMKLIETFFSYKLPTIKSAKELAEALSKKAKLLKDLTKEQLEEDISKVNNGEEPSSVYDFYKGLEELIKDINIDDCADAYAQTIAYGLFLAKINCPDKLDRKSAATYIPDSIGVIKRIFINISGYSLSSNVAWIVEEIIDILNASEIQNILSEIDFRGKKDRDSFTFFYEDFLNLYDPKKRKHLGIYYTPRPVVNFIVKSIEQILKNDFNKLNGFGEDDVTVLDPAVGTGTFLWLVYLRTLVDLKERNLGGLIKTKIENHILKDFYGFEILITPYVIAHLKLTTVINKWFYNFKGNDRIQVYLTNTLEPTEIHGLMPFLRELTEESITANKIKVKKPILVILGNPPYAGISANKGKWIEDLLKEGYTRADGGKDDGYYQVDGKTLEEKNPKWLQDDYVKFIRFAQWKIDKSGEGIIGFITNHSYLDNPTFRGMRESLMNSFDRIYFLNLHGNSLKKEKCPDGSKDENVFDIRQGTSIALFVKNSRFKDKKIFYSDFYGLREHKYYWLDRNKVDTVAWREIKPMSPYYFFVPKDVSLQREYEKYWKITDIFPVNSVGVVTSRDSFVIGFDKETLKKHIKTFGDENISDEYFKQNFKLRDKKNWKLRDARKSVIENKNWENSITQILYRPFDTHWIFYDDSLIERSRKEVMQHMMKGNLGLCIGRQWSVIGSHIYDIVFVSDKIVDFNLFRRGGELVFPLYLYSNTSKRESNFTDEFLEFIKKGYPNQKITPEDILGYIYTVLHSNTYRKKYEEFLKIDFPRIPFVDDYDKFKQLSEIGKELVNLHLMKNKLKTGTKFDVQGSNIVKFVKYKDNKVYVNKDQFFGSIPEEAWNFYIGGYQVLDKWLKSRKNRELSGNEIEQFIQIVEIINQTIRYMKKIEEIKIVEEDVGGK